MMRLVRPVVLVATVLLVAIFVALPIGYGLLACLTGAFGAWAVHWSHRAPEGDSVLSLAVRGRSNSPASLGAVLDAMPTPAILIDKRAIVIIANTAALRSFPGLKAAAPLSLGLRDPVVLGAVSSCLKGAVIAEAEMIERMPVERAFAVTVTRLEEPASEQQRKSSDALAMLVLRDMTRERRLETTRVDFVANASHELRTPLAAVLGFIETLQGPARNDTAAREKFLAIMAQQAGRMARLVDDLLSLSRIELKEHLAHTGSVDIADVISQTIDGLSGLARDRKVTMSLLREGTGPFLVIGDRDELLQVFENLVENAIKYGRSGSRVDVTLVALPDSDDLRISVRDFGPGIPEAHLPRLTERFYRVDSAVSKAEGGTGLGLSITKHIIGRHRGRLQIQSLEGQGATFTVSLPKASAAVMKL